MIEKNSNQRSLAHLLVAISVFILVSFSHIELAIAQVSNPQARMEILVKEMLRTDGVLTLQKHREFWSAIRQFPANEQADFLSMVNVAILSANEYQAEVWESAHLSYRNRKIIKTGRLIALEKETRAQFLAALPKTLSPKVREDSIRAYDSKRAIALSNSERLLESAAEHRSFKINDKESVEINEASIEKLTSGLKPAIERVKRLLNPSWADGPQVFNR